MKSLIVWLLLSLSLVFGVSTSTKIENSQKDLSKMSADKKKASRKLDNIASDMNKAEKDINYLEHILEKLGTNKEKSEKEYKKLKKELATSEANLKVTSTEIDEKHKSFVSLLSDQFSVIYAMKQFENPTQKSIISYEVYKAYKKQNAKELKSLRSDIAILKKSKKNKRYQRDKTKKSITSIIKKRKLYKNQKEQKKKLVASLGDDEEKYQSKLQNLVDKQSSLRSTLAKLNILQKQEVEDARKRAAEKREAIRLEKERKRKIRRAKALARKKAKKAKKAKAAIRRAKTEKAKKAAILVSKKADNEAKIARKRVYKKSEKVRKVHSSYKKSKTFAYRGGKTISPIVGARLIKKFGTYIDPVYKIKIFNESVTLRAPNPNAKVQNILNGKVVFAGKSSMLGKVVVIAHSGKMHTVYAGLSKIAPTIRVGSKIRRGYVVGKVSRKLIFQATKNSKHINPIRLISI